MFYIHPDERDKAAYNSSYLSSDGAIGRTWDKLSKDEQLTYSTMGWLMFKHVYTGPKKDLELFNIYKENREKPLLSNWEQFVYAKYSKLTLEGFFSLEEFDNILGRLIPLQGKRKKTYNKFYIYGYSEITNDFLTGKHIGLILALKEHEDLATQRPAMLLSGYTLEPRPHVCAYVEYILEKLIMYYNEKEKRNKEFWKLAICEMHNAIISSNLDIGKDRPDWDRISKEFIMYYYSGEGDPLILNKFLYVSRIITLLTFEEVYKLLGENVPDSPDELCYTDTLQFLRKQLSKYTLGEQGYKKLRLLGAENEAMVYIVANTISKSLKGEQVPDKVFKAIHSEFRQRLLR